VPEDGHTPEVPIALITYSASLDQKSFAMNRRHFLQITAQAAASAALAALLAPLRALAAEHNKLKITAVEPYLLRGGRCFVLVRTSEGITGIGEVSPMNSAVAAELIRTAFVPLLVGTNPLDIERCWERIFYRTYKQGVMGLQPEALAGVDLALWDILGKVSGLPVHQLLGGKRRDSVRMYSSIGGGAHMTPQQMAKLAEEAVNDGFTMVKIRMDYGPVPPDVNTKHDLEVLKTVRSAIGPDIELGYDVNNGYSVPTAIRMGKAIEAFHVIHYEEPVAQTNYRGYAQVVEAVDIPVAAGEHEYTRWQFRDLIEQANPDILQPDLVKCAGLTEAIKIAALASTYHKILVPHQTQPTIGQAATLHYTSVFVAGETAQEISHNGMKSDLHTLFKNPLEFKKGRLTVPSGPGWGLELEEDKLKQWVG
jgi:L-alanine-DL-glutamate epimerase-like enolase superfamily enzyme